MKPGCFHICTHNLALVMDEHDLEAELQELAALEAESIGWLPLGDGARFKDWLCLSPLASFLSFGLKKFLEPRPLVLCRWRQPLSKLLFG